MTGQISVLFSFSRATDIFCSVSNNMVWVYPIFCAHAVANIPPDLHVPDTAILHSAKPTRWKVYFAEQELAIPAILPECYSLHGCNEMKLMKMNPNVTVAEYIGRVVPRTYLSWNSTAFPNITKAMAGEYVCENEYGKAE